MTKNTHFYVSFELSEVVDLVLKREKLLKSYRLTGNMDKVQASRCHLLTAKLETLVIKKVLNEIH